MSGGSTWVAGVARPLMMRMMRSLLTAMLSAWRTRTSSNGFLVVLIVM